jgi:hypothetical protein
MPESPNTAVDRHLNVPLIICWILVAVPLFWGVWQTLSASLALFR